MRHLLDVQWRWRWRDGALTSSVRKRFMGQQKVETPSQKSI